MMRNLLFSSRFFFLVFLTVHLSILAHALEPIRVYEFERLTLAENGWAEQFKGGFMNAQPGTAELQGFFGSFIPSSKDKRGLSIVVDPGQVTFLNTVEPILAEGKPVLLRMAVRSDGPGAQVALVALKGDLGKGLADGSIATHIPAGSAGFIDSERRLVLLYEPDGGQQITPVIQVAAAGDTTTHILIDRLEVFLLETTETYSGAEFSSSSLYSQDKPTATPTPIFLNSPTPTPPTVPPTSTPSFTPVTIPPTPTQPSGVSTEREPNDAYTQAQSIGSLNIGGTLTLMGNLSSGAVSNNQYAGDPDFYTFTLHAAADIKAELTWSNNADVDLYIAVGDRTIAGQADATKPIILTGTLAAGIYTVLIVSKSQGADYTLTLTASTPTKQVYENNVALLNGKYTKADGGLLYWYNFDGQGNYELWGWTPVSGEAITHYGRYEIRFPFILFHHDGEVEYNTLEFLTTNAILLDGVRYVRE